MKRNPMEICVILFICLSCSCSAETTCSRGAVKLSCLLFQPLPEIRAKGNNSKLHHQRKQPTSITTDYCNLLFNQDINNTLAFNTFACGRVSKIE